MEEKVLFYNPKNQKLVGILHTPADKTASIIIMTHGLSGNKDEHGLFVNAARNFCANGFYVLRFDCAGSGESEGRSRDVTRISEKNDLLSAIKYAKSIGMKKIGLCGLSMGAGVSVLAYSSEIFAMCLWSASINPRGLFQRYFKNKEYMKELKEKGYFLKIRDWGTFEIGKGLMDESKTMKKEPFVKK